MTMTKFQLRVCLLAVSAFVLVAFSGVSHKATAKGYALQSDDLSLPDKKGAWMVEVRKAGGRSYRLDGATINSDGEIVVSVGLNREPRINCSCRGKVTNEDLAKLQRAVSSAKPATWLERYEKGRVHDAPSSNINLSLRGDGSTEQSYHSSWVLAGGAAALRPNDLVQLNDLVWQIREKMKGQCQFQTE